MTDATKHWTIAILSDTHGLLRPEVIATCSGVDAILHAGDVGDPAILSALSALAPLTAIRGNIDISGLCGQLPATDMVQIGDITIYLVHSLADLDINPIAAGVQAVISGHSHKFAEEHRSGVLYLNPGSVGPRRFRLPISMALLKICGPSVEVEAISLTPKL
ncbi:MAG: metallophosphoesterase family protein [Janthinobacterium lividum]